MMRTIAIAAGAAIGLVLVAWAGVHFFSPGRECFLHYDAKNYVAAIPVCEETAKKGDTFSRRALADIYFVGRGVEPNYEKAYPLLLSIEQDDDAQTHYALGVVLLSKGFSGRNTSQAKQWLLKAASACHQQATMVLAVAHQTSEMFGSDPVESYKWFLLVRENLNAFGLLENRSRLEASLSDAEKRAAEDAAAPLKLQMQDRCKS